MKLGQFTALALMVVFLASCAESPSASQDRNSPAAISMPDKADSNSHVTTYGSMDLQTTSVQAK